MWPVFVVLFSLLASSNACPESCECLPPKLVCRVRLPTLDEFSQLSNYTQLELYDVVFGKFEYKDYAASNFFKALYSIKTHKANPRTPPRPYPLNLLHLDKLHSINVSRGDFDFYAAHRLCQFNNYPNLLSFDVSYNGLRTFNLCKEISVCFPKLAALNLTGNHLYFMQPNKFANSSIEDLDLSYNEFNSFVGVFNGMQCLRRLNLAGNKLENVRTDFFGGLTKLKELDISRNRLNYIYPSVFANTALERLDLSDNKIHNFENVFNGLQYLKKLNIAGNMLEIVEVDWFNDLGKLEELDISRNKLNFIPADTLQPLTSLSNLKVSENPLLERDLSFLLGTGRNLDTVDASRIGLVRVPVALTRSVRTLKLVGNHLNYITSGDLDSYPLLTSLDLSDNRLIIIEEDALGRLDALTELILSRNMLPAIPKSLSIWLRVLDLRQNAISKLKANDLQGLHRLKILNLSGNVIDSIEGEFFRQLTALEDLDISNNPIKKLPSDFLSGPTNLRTLRMSDLWLLETEANQNHDTAFPILALETLVTLDVSRSPLLASQLLADNAALSACKSLQELDLSYVRITSIRSDLAYMLPQLRKLNLIGNAWNCTPDQYWLGEWMRKHNDSRLYSTRCKTPPELEGKLLEEMTDRIEAETTLNSTVVAPKKPAFKESTKSSEEVTTLKSTTTHDDLTSTKATSSDLTKTESLPTTTTTSSSLKDTTGKSNQLVTSSTSGSQPAEVTDSVSNEKSIKTTSGVEKGLKETTTEAKELRISSPPSTTTTVRGESITVIDEERSSSTTTTTTSEFKEHVSKAINYESKGHSQTTTATPKKSNKKTLSITNDNNKTETTTTAARVMTKKSPKQLVKSEDEVYSKKSNLLTELSRSKLLEEPEHEPKSVAEELNGRSMDGAHPGMLILLGAAIGAAAALTVVLSRRAGVNRRDKQYQRHENVEVHALTERW